MARFVLFGPTMRPTLLLASTALLMAACIPPNLADDVVEEPGADPDSEPAPDPVPAIATDGAYAIESTLDVQAAAVLPQTAYDAVQTLRGLRDEPGRTLFDLAEEAGVPAVEEIRAALPSSLESRLYGWIDGELATYTHGDGPVATAIDDVLTICETPLAEVELASDLTITGATATHRLREVGFAIDGLVLRYDLANLDGLPLALQATVAATVISDGPVAQLTLSRHAFGLPFGQLALTAIEDVLQLRYGTDLRGVIGLLIDCPALAADVADQCYYGVCVGHEAQLLAVCEGGLDRLADKVRDELLAYDFDAITLHAGTAQLSDGATVDGVADAVVGGVWTADLDAGMGPRAAPGTFAGGR
jgi:hypothetical protein